MTGDLLGEEWLIGVTGHLQLSRKERDLVNRQARLALEDFFKGPDRPATVRVLSGLAPGSDLILTNAVFELAEQYGVPCHLTALIVDSPAALLEQWARHAELRGAPIKASTFELMEQAMLALLERAEQQLRIVPCSEDPNQGFRQLAAMLANCSDILIAALRADAEHSEGGARQVVGWRKNPENIPRDLLIGRPVKPGRQRHLIDIDPSQGRESQTREIIAEVVEVRSQLKAGNALGACDAAHRALRSYPRNPELRYLFLQSLAASGRSSEALRRYDGLAPPLTQSTEDWIALRGRLHKDLAFAGRGVAQHLKQAARCYEQAYEYSGGYFSAINAATMHLLAGHERQATAFARIVLSRAPPGNEKDETARYYLLASRAEAFAVLGEWDECRDHLKLIDPLLRDDLSTRARTLRQISRVVEHRRGDPAILKAMSMPLVFVLEEAMAQPPELPGDLAHAIEGAPVFSTLDASAAGAGPTLAKIESAGGRLTRMDAGPSAGNPSPEAGKAMDGEALEWHRRRRARDMAGLAHLNAALLGVEVRALGVRQHDGRAAEWVLGPHLPVTVPEPGRQRRMVGLVFGDLVGFSRYDDATINLYWKMVVPRLAEALAPFMPRMLLRQTWGDALHLVTEDVLTAARATQAMLACIREMRQHFPNDGPRLDMRVGAHFAPVGTVFDAISERETYFGSQLSLTARVEPVTPPGTVYVTKEFACELQLVAPGEFDVMYAGQVPLAKDYGEYRLYALHEILQARSAPKISG